MSDPKSDVTAIVVFCIVFVLVVGGVAVLYENGADLGWFASVCLAWATGVALSGAVRPIRAARVRRMRVAADIPPGPDRRMVGRAVLHGPAPLAGPARAVALAVVEEELESRRRGHLSTLAATGLLVVMGLLIASLEGGVMWLLPGVAIVELLVLVLRPRWLRRRLAVLGADVPAT